MDVSVPGTPSFTVTYSGVGQVYEKIYDMALMSDYGYSFEIPPEVTLRLSNPNPRSINGRLGNMNTGDANRAGEKNSTSDRGEVQMRSKADHGW